MPKFRNHRNKTQNTLLSFFKVNDPFRLSGVVLYLLIIGFVLLVLFSFPITKPTLIWLLLGERLSQGFFLYQDVIDDTGPLSAGFFTGIFLLFGKNVIVFEILGRILVFIQIIYWNNTLIKYRVFDENTYLPSIIMAALYHYSFDMVSLSPPLLGSIFLMFALGQLFSQTILQKETSESPLLIGLYGGLATGFHVNFILFLPYIIFTGLAISGFSVRQLFLTLSGFVLPILLILVFYFWNDRLEDALEILPNIFTYETDEYQSLSSWLIPGILPLVLAILGFFLSVIFGGSTINQQKQRQLIILWLLFSFSVFFLVKKQASYQLLILIPGLTYLITQFFLYLKSKFIANFLFILLVIGLPIGGTAYWKSRSELNETYFVKQKNWKDEFEGKTFMVLGNDLSYYLDAQLGGPFLNYNLTKKFLMEEKTLEQKASIFSRIINQSPDVIIDEEGVFKNLIEDLPPLQELYFESEKGQYLKRSND